MLMSHQGKARERREENQSIIDFSFHEKRSLEYKLEWLYFP